MGSENVLNNGEVTELSRLFQSVSASLKHNMPLWEELILRSTRLYVAIRSMLQLTCGVLETLQKLADQACASPGSSRDVGLSLVRLCMRQRSLDHKVRNFHRNFMDGFIQPLQSKLSHWRKSLSQIEREHQRTLKQAKSNLKKAQNNCKKANSSNQKKRKGMSILSSSGSISKTSENSDGENTRNMEIVKEKQLLLQSTEQQSLYKLLTEERNRYCFLVTCLRPALTHQISMISDLSGMDEIMKELDDKCSRSTEFSYSLPVEVDNCVYSVDSFTDLIPSRAPSVTRTPITNIPSSRCSSRQPSRDVSLTRSESEYSRHSNVTNEVYVETTASYPGPQVIHRQPHVSRCPTSNCGGQENSMFPDNDLTTNLLRDIKRFSLGPTPSTSFENESNGSQHFNQQIPLVRSFHLDRSNIGSLFHSTDEFPRDYGLPKGPSFPGTTRCSINLKALPHNKQGMESFVCNNGNNSKEQEDDPEDVLTPSGDGCLPPFPIVSPLTSNNCICDMNTTDFYNDNSALLSMKLPGSHKEGQVNNHSELITTSDSYQLRPNVFSSYKICNVHSKPSLVEGTSSSTGNSNHQNVISTSVHGWPLFSSPLSLETPLENGNKSHFVYSSCSVHPQSTLPSIQTDHILSLPTGSRNLGEIRDTSSHKLSYQSYVPVHSCGANNHHQTYETASVAPILSPSTKSPSTRNISFSIEDSQCQRQNKSAVINGDNMSMQGIINSYGITNTVPSNQSLSTAGNSLSQVPSSSSFTGFLSVRSNTCNNFPSLSSLQSVAVKSGQENNSRLSGADQTSIPQQAILRPRWLGGDTNNPCCRCAVLNDNSMNVAGEWIVRAKPADEPSQDVWVVQQPNYYQQNGISKLPYPPYSSPASDHCPPHSTSFVTGTLSRGSSVKEREVMFEQVPLPSHILQTVSSLSPNAGGFPSPSSATVRRRCERDRSLPPFPRRH